MKRWILGSLALILLLVCVAVIYLYTPAGKQYVKSQIIQQLESATGYPTNIEEFYTNYLSRTGIEGMTIQDTTTGAHLRMSRVKLDYRIFPVLKGVIQIDSIRSSGINLDFSAEFLDNFTGQAGSGNQSDPNWSLRVEHVSVDSSNLHYIDYENKIDVDLQNITLNYNMNETVYLAVSEIDASYNGNTLENLALSASGSYDNGQWKLPDFAIAGVETPSNIQGSLATGDTEQSYNLTLNGFLSEDMIDFVLILIDPNLRKRIDPTGVRIAGGLNYSPEIIGYHADLSIDTLSYDTLTFEAIRANVEGNTDSLHVKRLRTNLGRVDDTLSTRGSIDWQQQALQLDLQSHLTSVSYFKHILQLETSFDSDFDLHASVRLPYSNIIETSGQGKLTFQNPQYEGVSIAPINLNFSLSDTTWRTEIIHRSNKLSLESTSKFPLIYSGDLVITDFSDIGQIYNISQQSFVKGNFTGSFEKGGGISADGNVNTDIYLQDNNLPISLQVPFEVRSTEIEVQEGQIAIADLPPMQIYAGVMLQPRLNALVELREINSSNSGGLIRFTAARDSAQIIGRGLISQLQIGPYLQFVTGSSQPFNGTLSGEGQFSTGPDSLGLGGKFTLADVKLPRAQQQIDSLTAQFSPASEGVNLSIGYHMRSESRTWVDGYVPFSPKNEMALQVTTGRQTLSTFNPLLPESWFLAGYLTPDLNIRGTYTNPSLVGTVEFDSVYVQWNDRREPLQQITGIAEFDNRSFTIDELTLRYFNYPVTLAGSGSFEPSLDANITVEPRGEIHVHYSQPASDSASLSITDLPLDLFQDFIPARVRSEGSLTSEVHYLSTLDTLLITSSGNVNPELSGAKSDWRLQWDGAYNGSTLNVNRFRFGNSDENIALSGYVQHFANFSERATDSTNVPSTDLDLRLQIQDFQLTSLNTFNQDWNFESGLIRGSLSIGGSAALPEIDGSISGSSMAWVNAFQDFRIEDGNFRWEFNGSGVDIRRTAATINTMPLTLQGKVMYGENQMIDVNLKGKFAEDTPIELRLQHNAEKNLFRGYAAITELQVANILTAVASEQQISALGDIELKIGGTRDQPQIELESDFRDILIGDIPFNKFTLNSHYENQSILLDTLRLGRENAFIQGFAEISGQIDVREMQMEGIGDTISLQLSSNAFPMSALNEIIPENYNLGGNTNINFSYNRTPENSDMDGSFEVAGFSSDLPYFQQRVSDGHLLATFGGSVISFSNTYFIIDESTQNLTGSITLHPGANPEYDISLNTEKVQLANPGEVTLTLAPSDIRMETTAGEPAMVSGTVRVSSFRYTKPVANIQLLSLIGTRTVRPERFTQQMLQDIRLNLSLQMLQDAEVDNNLAELDFNADIQLSGPLLQPRYSGRVTSQSGEIFYLRKTFSLEKALVLFGDRPGLNPDLNITAQTVIQPHENVDNIEYTITLNVTGSLANPNVQFAAAPPARPVSNETLTQSDIIGLLTIGRPRPQLASAEENSSFTQTLMRQASRYSSAQIASVLEYQVKRLLDLDRVSIEGNLFSLSGTNQPIFTAQKSLTDRLSLTYSTSIGESNMQGLRLNYRIGEHFYIVTETTQREETQYGVDLKYKIQF